MDGVLTEPLAGLVSEPQVIAVLEDVAPAAPVPPGLPPTPVRPARPPVTPDVPPVAPPVAALSWPATPALASGGDCFFNTPEEQSATAMIKRTPRAICRPTLDLAMLVSPL